MAQPNEVTTRVNKAMVGTYVGRTVRAIGRVLSYKGDVLELQLADGGVVFVHDLGNRHEVGSIIEVIAKVRDPENLEEYNTLLFNNEFNMENLNALLNLSLKFPDLFGTA